MTLAFATGDPAGVGPAVSAVAALEVAREGEAVLVFGDAAQLAPRLPSARVMPQPIALAPGEIAIVDTGRVDAAVIARHAPSPEVGAAQLRALDAATRAVRDGHARALVTAPTSKEAVTMSGTPFVGQTEHLARGAGLRDDEVTMLFLGPRLRLALVTTHLAVRDVPREITKERVERATVHLGEAMARLGRAHGAKVAVAALNPHAGESGMFGDEEARVIAPAVDAARAREPYASGRLSLIGIVPAETALRRAAEGAIDGVVAMMHDQATIASKLLDWGAAVNVTWGLPFVRASVDHGVAYDAASRDEADAAGMIAAARCARVLAGSA
ncbi:PdxA family dehydrogenase [Sandaracinus amylolyticus]|uniref:PdxA family dehydrogenase n=1 Tax=Sandaracinus amylolyticus TaxID=927083 RepID=UPI001F475343|nr:4-hydroxythreonine-4-phosphate dehydrogenase PdxA [Sandaracinus amylolyticus]UJR81039.1 4-hydroxythreonine-4-phosphate dehydrogenase PdxA [Sandaracinus amylolyticus]